MNARAVLFSALDPFNYVEPWTTDGTPVGTRRLKDIHPGPQGSMPVDYTVLRGVVYFGADDSLVDHGNGTVTYHRELFRTDGTEAGTYRVKDINPGPDPSRSVWIHPPGWPPASSSRRRRPRFRTVADGWHRVRHPPGGGHQSGSGEFQSGALRSPRAAGQNPPAYSCLPPAMRRTARSFTGATSPSGAPVWSRTSTRTAILSRSRSPPSRVGCISTRTMASADGSSGSRMARREARDSSTISVPERAFRRRAISRWGGGDTLFVVTTSPGAVEASVKTQLWATDGSTGGTRLVYEEPGSSFGYSIRNLTALEKNSCSSLRPMVSAPPGSARTKSFFPSA